MIQQFLDVLRRQGLEYFKRYYGEYTGEVVDNQDPQNQDRVKVRVPTLGLPSGRDVLPNWAYPIAGPFTPGSDKGSSFVPRVGDLVMVSFINGNSSLPRYMSHGWFAKDEKPSEFETVEDRGWKTHSGHVVRFRDLAGGEEVLIQHRGGGKIEMSVDDTIRVETVAGDVVVMDPSGSITVEHRLGTRMELDDTSATIETLLLATIKAQQVVLQASQTKLSAKGAVHPVPKGDLLLNYLQALHAWLLLFANTHQHTSAAPGAPTVPPNIIPGLPPSPPPTMLSVKTTTG